MRRWARRVAPALLPLIAAEIAFGACTSERPPGALVPADTGGPPVELPDSAARVDAFLPGSTSSVRTLDAGLRDPPVDARAAPRDATLRDAGVTDPPPHDASASRDVAAPVADAARAGRDGAHDARPPAVDASSDRSDGASSGPLSASYVHYDVNHVLVTGQSNAVSNAGSPVLSTTQPFTNLMFDTGVMHVSGCDGIGCTGYRTPSSLVPLVEGDSFFDFATETACAGLANEVSLLAQEEYGFGTHPGYPASHNVIMTLNGRSGNTYQCLRKGGCPYQASDYLRAFEQGLMDVTNAQALAKASGLTYVVRGVLAIHGESDHYDYTSGTSEFPMGGTDGVADEIQNYGDGLIEWQRDYEASIQAITGQTEPVVLFVSGLSGWTDTTTSLIPTYQLQAHMNAPGKVVLVTPGYPMQVYMDCEHYNDYGERRVGEYAAKAYARIVLGGQRWEPVRPRTITRSGAVVVVDYYVPTPPLAWDTTRVAPAPSYGFDFVDNGTVVPIASVALTGPTIVTITLAATPSGKNMALRYAQNQPAVDTGCIGPGTTYARSASGNLRDSDTTKSLYSDGRGVPYDMFDWGVIYELPVQ